MNTHSDFPAVSAKYMRSADNYPDDLQGYAECVMNATGPRESNKCLTYALDGALRAAAKGGSLSGLMSSVVTSDPSDLTRPSGIGNWFATTACDDFSCSSKQVGEPRADATMPAKKKKKKK